MRLQCFSPSVLTDSQKTSFLSLQFILLKNRSKYEGYYVSLSVYIRNEFNLKLTLLSNQWQGVIRRVQQRRGIIDSQIHQWQRYREMAEKLRKWLVEISCQPVSGLRNVPIPLQQARALLDEVQVCPVCLKEEKNHHLLYSLHNLKNSLKCIRLKLSALQKVMLNVSSSLELEVGVHKEHEDLTGSSRLRLICFWFCFVANVTLKLL